MYTWGEAASLAMVWALVGILTALLALAVLGL